jgi:DNA-binding transcriptional MocR family regulator
MQNSAEIPRLLYDRVASILIGQIEDGTLVVGDRVPSLRKMSGRLNVSISTVMQAYMNLEDRGFIRSRPQSGYYVCQRHERGVSVPEKSKPRGKPRKVQLANTVETIFGYANRPGIVRLGVANPGTDLLPVKALTRALRKISATHLEDAVDYCMPPGEIGLRRQIAFRSADIDTMIDADDIVITNGATEALVVSLQAVAKPGDVVAVESPAYFSVLQTIQTLGMLALEIPTDSESGLCLDSLRDAIDENDVKAVVAVPNFHNPTGALMPDDVKKDLVELLHERSIPLIEDDVYGDLYFGERRPRTCQAFDSKGLVLTCSSFSKTLAPGYRVGWIIPGRFRSEVMQRKQLLSSGSAGITQLAVAEFLRSGGYDRHLIQLRRRYREQLMRLRESVAEYFPDGTRITRPQGGFVLWIQLPRGVDSIELYENALQHKIGVTPGSLFSTTGKYKNFIRLCAGHPWSDAMEQGVSTLGRLVHELAND